MCPSLSNLRAAPFSSLKAAGPEGSVLEDKEERGLGAVVQSEFGRAVASGFVRILLLLHF